MSKALENFMLHSHQTPLPPLQFLYWLKLFCVFRFNATPPKSYLFAYPSDATPSFFQDLRQPFTPFVLPEQ